MDLKIQPIWDYSQQYFIKHPHLLIALLKHSESRKWMKELTVEGRQPQPRSFHSCTAVGSRAVVIGGRGPSDQHYQDFHVFDSG